MLTEAVRTLPQALDEPEPTVRVSAIGSSNVDLTVGVWVGSTLLDELDAVDALIPLVLTTLERHDIDMPPEVIRVAGGAAQVRTVSTS